MEIIHLYIAPEHQYFGRHEKGENPSPIKEVDSIECVAGKGIVGDRFFDWKEDYKGQITFFAHETYERLQAELGITDRPPSVFRRNVVTQGLDLPALIGQEFEVNGVRFAGTEEARPCYWMNSAFGEGAEDALKSHGGLRARILSSGLLHRS